MTVAAQHAALDAAHRESAGSAATYSLEVLISGLSAAEYAEVKFLSNHTVAVLLSMNHGNGFSANSRYLSLSLSLLR